MMRLRRSRMEWVDLLVDFSVIVEDYGILLGFRRAGTYYEL
jgi:hypothetical protein